MSILKRRQILEHRVKPAVLKEAVPPEQLKQKGVVFKGSEGKPKSAFMQNALDKAVQDGISDLFDDVFEPSKLAAAIKAGLKKQQSSIDPETYATATHAVDGLVKKVFSAGAPLRSKLADAMGAISTEVWQELQKHADAAKTESKHHRRV